MNDVRKKPIAANSYWDNSESLEEYVSSRMNDEDFLEILTSCLRDRFSNPEFCEVTKSVIEETVSSYSEEPFKSYPEYSREKAENVYKAWVKNKTVSSLLSEDWDVFPTSCFLSTLLTAVFFVDPILSLSHLDNLNHPQIVLLVLRRALNTCDDEVTALTSAPEFLLESPNGKLSMTLLFSFTNAINREQHNLERRVFSNKPGEMPSKKEIIDSVDDILMPQLNAIMQRPDWSISGPLLALWLAQKIVFRNTSNKETDIYKAFWIGALHSVIEKLFKKGLTVQAYDVISKNASYATPSDYPASTSSLLCVAIHCASSQIEVDYDYGIQYFANVMSNASANEDYIPSSFLENGYVSQRIGILVANTSIRFALLQVMEDRLNKSLFFSEYKSNPSMLLRVLASVIQVSTSGLVWLIDGGKSKDEAIALWENTSWMALKYWRMFFDIDVDNCMKRQLLMVAVHYVILPETRPILTLSQILRGIGRDTVFLCDIAVNLKANAITIDEIDAALMSAGYDLVDLLQSQADVAAITTPNREVPSEEASELLIDLTKYRTEQ